jgi:2-polyprenyl-3-methyl-5-hydroxy-6-metoxy-1,4-benzoquinol methylase
MPESQSESSHEVNDRLLFDRIASSYCRKDLNSAAKIARQYRLEATLAVIPTTPRAAILELGCGAGFAVHSLPPDFRSYVGLDYSKELISYAKEFNSPTNCEFVATNIKQYDGCDFDLIFAIGLLHHLDDPTAVLTQVVSWLKPGGWLVANEPHPRNVAISIARRIRKQIDASYSDNQRELTEQELYRLYAAAGLTDIRISAQGFLSTPLAEVPMEPQWALRPVSRTLCSADRLIGALLGRLGKAISWNLIAAGRKKA